MLSSAEPGAAPRRVRDSADVTGRNGAGGVEPMCGQTGVMGMGDTADAAQAAASRTARGPWLARVGRAGLAAKAALYAVLALLIVQLGRGAEEESVDQQGAMETIATQPFGRVLLGVLVIGLAGYALFRLTQAAIGAGVDDGAKGVLQRVSLLARALVYAGLAFLAAQVLTATAESDREQSTTAAVLGQPFGVVLVVAVGLGLVGVGLYQAYRGLSRGFLDDVRLDELDDDQRPWLVGLGVAGHLSRTVVFGATGGFVVSAALFGDTSEVGLDATLSELVAAPFGGMLVFLVAAGLLAYAGWCVVLVRFGRIRSLE